MNRKDVKYFKSENGEYKYIGKYYRFGISGADLKKRKIAFLLLFLLALAAFVVMGFLDNGQSREFYVALPMVISLMPAGLGAAAAFSMLGMPENMTIVQFKSGPRRIQRCALALTAAGLACLVGAGVRAAVKGSEMRDLPFFAAAAAEALCGIAAARLYAGCPASETQ